jgi:hypothetical protein
VRPGKEQPCQARTQTVLALRSGSIIGASIPISLVRQSDSPWPWRGNPSCRAGAEPGTFADSAQGRGERTADTRRANLVDGIPSITLIGPSSIIVTTLTVF